MFFWWVFCAGGVQGIAKGAEIVAGAQNAAEPPNSGIAVASLLVDFDCFVRFFGLEASLDPPTADLIVAVASAHFLLLTAQSYSRALLAPILECTGEKTRGRLLLYLNRKRRL